VPLYEYKCLKCGRQTERIEKHAGPHLKKCPHCGGRVERMASAPAIQFKGSGWYVNDYSKKTSGGEVSKGESQDVAGAKEAKETKEGKESKDKKETKETKETKESASKEAPKKKVPPAKKD
jgi:putative FmdB family regulatory protein